MKTSKLNKRWFLWLPLLGLAAWLGLFADKSPSDQLVLPSLKRADQTAPSIATSSRPLNPPSTKADEQLKGAREPSNDVQVALSSSSKGAAALLEALVDRGVLIVPDQKNAAPWRNLFTSTSWTPPPPPVKAMPPVAPPAPVAPPLPFKYMGKKFEANVWEVYLLRGEQSFLAREGSTIEGTYRVDSITSEQLNVTYLPLGQSQNLSIGESQ